VNALIARNNDRSYMNVAIRELKLSKASWNAPRGLIFNVFLIKLTEYVIFTCIFKLHVKIEYSKNRCEFNRFDWKLWVILIPYTPFLWMS
jgi:hypothetical protein